MDEADVYGRQGAGLRQLSAASAGTVRRVRFVHLSTTTHVPTLQGAIWPCRPQSAHWRNS